MEREDVSGILKIIIASFGDKKLIWRLDGSANLLVQGVEVSVRDLDITTNGEGINVFRESLKEFIVKDVYSEKIKGLSLVCDISGFEVEINSYGDRELDLFGEIKEVSWEGLRVKILPLKYAKLFYEKIGRLEKVKLIETHFKSKSL
jgi:hypothetical protein